MCCLSWMNTQEVAHYVLRRFIMSHLESNSSFILFSSSWKKNPCFALMLCSYLRLYGLSADTVVMLRFLLQGGRREPYTTVN